LVLYTILTTIKINRFWKRNCGYILHLYQKKLLTHFGRKCWHWRLTLWYPCLLQVFGFDNFSITICQTTGCPKKHGNSVTNSISSFQIILWFSIVIPTEKAVICKSIVCYVYICLFMFWLHTVVLSKTRKLQYTNRVNLSVFSVHLAETL